MNELTITRPDDWHVHLRDGAALEHTCADLARYFGRVIVMPNLSPPATTVAEAAQYRDRILAAMAPLQRHFEPLMTLYLTDRTDAAEIALAAASSFVHAVKLYPAGATTNSAAGVARLEGLYRTLAAMEEVDLPLLVHGEVTDHDIDIFDREKVFIDRHLAPISGALSRPAHRVRAHHHPGCGRVRARGPQRNSGDHHRPSPAVQPQRYAGRRYPAPPLLPADSQAQHPPAGSCRRRRPPVIPRFFLGTDSAPHSTGAKETRCGCAGVYTAHAAIEFYAEVFEQLGALDALEAFAAHFGPDFYRLPRNTDSITLRQEQWQVPEQLPLGRDFLTPLRAGEGMSWRVLDRGI